ncbi:response regulator [Marinobacterium sp. xm-a-152]|uniref:response regulator n=1 Tax=Marinobacterium sp. xm-a-152 TaxID=2497733 RepID=UPI001569197A|nr:response regulator [Marinobacterium sp. xm-a-152]
MIIVSVAPVNAKIGGWVFVLAWIAIGLVGLVRPNARYALTIALSLVCFPLGVITVWMNGTTTLAVSIVFSLLPIILLANRLGLFISFAYLALFAIPPVIHQDFDTTLYARLLFSNLVLMGGAYFIISFTHRNYIENEEKQSKLVRSALLQDAALAMDETDILEVAVDDMSVQYLRGTSATAIEGTFEEKIRRSLVDTALADQIIRAIKSDAVGGERWVYELYTDSSRTETRWLKILISQSYSRGNTRYRLIVRRDITIEKQGELELRETGDRLRSELAKQDQLFAIIGHELRTPASALKMLIEDQRISELEPHGGVIAETAEHLLRVLDDMRIVTQPERVLESPELKGSVPAMIQRSLPLLGRLLVEQGLSVYVEASEQSNAHCVVREQLLRQIALNIVKNAALHAHATEMRIGIEAEDLGESIRFTLEFADNGRGIPAEQQEQIFEAFERGDTEAEGTGLGLHISRTYAQNILNGDLTYRDNEPQGAIFTLTAVFNKTSLELEKAEQEAKQIAQMNLLDGLTVLYAEDSPVLRMTTVKQLQNKGATVLVATDGREALEIADNQSFDLVITDIFMPNLDGYGVTSGIRERGFDCPIIGVTAAVVGDETDRLIACGANAALAKPLDIAALQKVIAYHGHLIHALNKSEYETARRRRVLVIDDDPITLARFEVLLENDFDVRTQESALKAIEDFKAFNPDVILCDVNMPDMNGFEVFKEIHSLDPSVPIIQISGTRASEHYLSIAKTMGAAEIMEKTSDGDEVLHLLHQVLRSNIK